MHHFPSGVEIQVVLLLRMRTCCLDPSIIVSFKGVSGILNSIWSEEVIDFIFPYFSWSSHSSLCRFWISCWGQSSIKLLSLPVFLPVAKRCSSLVSISFFCVFWSSIGFLLFPSVAWLPQCFSPCIQSMLLHKKILERASSPAVACCARIVARHIAQMRLGGAKDHTQQNLQCR